MIVRLAKSCAFHRSSRSQFATAGSKASSRQAAHRQHRHRHRHHMRLCMGTCVRVCVCDCKQRRRLHEQHRQRRQHKQHGQGKGSGSTHGSESAQQHCKRGWRSCPTRSTCSALLTAIAKQTGAVWRCWQRVSSQKRINYIQNAIFRQRPRCCPTRSTRSALLTAIAQTNWSGVSLLVARLVTKTHWLHPKRDISPMAALLPDTLNTFSAADGDRANKLERCVAVRGASHYKNALVASKTRYVADGRAVARHAQHVQRY
jgi:hypothetical protein